MACREGCHHCCRRIATLLPVEFAFLASEISDRPWHLRCPASLRDAVAVETGPVPSSGRTAAGALRSDLHPGEPLCGLLDAQGACTAYPVRPLICRTHGFLLLTEEGIDHCPWNFEDLEEVDEDHPFRLENLHETLLKVNLAFLRRSWPSRWRELAEVRVRFQEETENRKSAQSG